MNQIPNIITSISVIIILWLVLQKCTPDSAPVLQSPVVRTDTVYREVPSEPVIISKVKTKIIYRSDSAITTMPFTAAIDTVINRDTLKAEFVYPENIFSMTLRTKPDTLTLHKINMYSSPKQSSWWEVPLSILGGAVLGYALGRIK